MSSSSSEIIAQLTVEYSAVSTGMTCAFVATTLLSYDVALTFGREYRYIWHSPKTWVSRVVYVWNRYTSLLYYILNLGSIPPLSNAGCSTIVWLALSVQILALVGPGIFTTLRIYALSKKNRILGGVALGLSMAPFIVNVSTAYQKVPLNAPAPLGCGAVNSASNIVYLGSVIASRGCLILADSLAVLVAWRQTRAAKGTTAVMRRRRSLEQVMWDNGSIYFCTLVTLNLVNLVLVIASVAIEGDGAGPGASYVLVFIDPISSILNSRFLLALHETNARMEGADASISSLSFDINNGDHPTLEGSPALPGYLQPLGGTIHSFPDDDDVESLEFAQPEEEAHESEEIANECVGWGREAGEVVV